jgi:hypothetical protein
MADELEKQRSAKRREYHAFLDKRIPELQDEGKPFLPPDPPDLTMAEKAKRIEANVAGSKYPGRKAREQADREWAELQSS